RTALSSRYSDGMNKMNGIKALFNHPVHPVNPARFWDWPLLPPGSVEDPARPGSRHRAILVHHLSVDDHVRKPGGILVRLLEGRHVPDARRIEHRDVRLHALLEHAPVGEPDARRREGRHLAHRLLESEKASLPHIFGENAGERAVAARMGNAAAEDHDLAV